MTSIASSRPKGKQEPRWHHFCSGSQGVADAVGAGGSGSTCTWRETWTLPPLALQQERDGLLQDHHVLLWQAGSREPFFRVGELFASSNCERAGFRLGAFFTATNLSSRAG